MVLCFFGFFKFMFWSLLIPPPKKKQNKKKPVLVPLKDNEWNLKIVNTLINTKISNGQTTITYFSYVHVALNQH